jgi:hypothetical protein
MPKIIRIESDDDENVAIYVGENLIVNFSYDDDGWSGDGKRG